MNGDADRLTPGGRKVVSAAEAFIREQKRLVDERRHHLDRVNRLLPEQAQSITPLPDTRAPTNVAGELRPGHVGDRDVELPKSEAQKQAEAEPEIPRDKHGVPDFQVPDAPAAATDVNEAGVPDFQLRKAPAPIGDEDDPEE